MDEKTLRTIISEAIIFFILLVCIIIRISNYIDASCSWIWIINYVGMAVALLNLFVSKTISFYNKGDNRYKSFLGFTITLTLFLCFMSLKISELQSGVYVGVTNDVVTLLALFFSLSPNIWNSILNLLSKIIK